MKHKYNIKVDAPMPTDTQVDRHKDFNRLLANYETLTQPLYKKPLYKNPKALLGVMLIVTIALLVFWTVEQDDKAEAKAKSEAILAQIEKAKAESFLHSPSASIAHASVKAQFDPAKGLEWSLNPQLKLSLPPNSLSQPGQTAQLELQASTKTAEWIAQGLPMESPDHLLRCLQVVQAKLSLDGSPVELSPNNAIELSYFPPEDYAGKPKVFLLDSTARKWMGSKQALEESQIDTAGKPRLNDGFTVIEFDDNGRPIRKPKPGQDGKQVKVIRYRIGSSGYYALAEEAIATSELLSLEAQFLNENEQPLSALSIYAVPEKAEGLQLFFPKNADYIYDLKLRKDRPTILMAFLPDGKLAYSPPIGPELPADQVLKVKMKEFDAPVNNIDALTQRMRDLQGL